MQSRASRLSSLWSDEKLAAATVFAAAAGVMTLPTNICLLIHVVLAALILQFVRRSVGLGNIVIALHVAVVLLFSVFGTYVLGNADRVIIERMFDFRVFSEELLRRVVALNDCALGSTLFIYGLFPALRRRSQMFSQIKSAIPLFELPRQAIFLPASLLAGWLIIFWSVLFTSTVLQTPYPENQQLHGALPPTPRALLVFCILGLATLQFIYDGYRVSAKGWLLRLTAYASIFWVGLMDGPRGGMVGLLLGMAAMDLAYGRASRLRKTGLALISVAFAVFAVVNWPYMRATISTTGYLDSLRQSFSQYSFISGVTERSDGIRLSDVPMLGQSVFHFLYSIALIDSGNSLHGQTFLNLIPQQLPDFLDGILWTRPVNDNWLLADQFVHGGGFYSYANAYWNGGAAPLFAFSIVLAFVIAWIEIFFKKLSTWYAGAYGLLIIMVPVGIYYGIQGLLRGIEFGFVAYWICKIFEPKYRSRIETAARRNL